MCVCLPQCTLFPLSPPPDKNTKLDNLCLSFLLSITVVPRETEDNDCAKCGGRRGGAQTGCIMGDVQMANWSKMIFILIQLKLIFTRIVSYTLKVRVFGTQKWEITLNPRPPCGLIFFPTTFEGGRLIKFSETYQREQGFSRTDLWFLGVILLFLTIRKWWQFSTGN